MLVLGLGAGFISEAPVKYIAYTLEKSLLLDKYFKPQYLGVPKK
jgi:hypothetical protein